MEVAVPVPVVFFLFLFFILQVTFIAPLFLLTFYPLLNGTVVNKNITEVIVKKEGRTKPAPPLPVGMGGRR